MKLPPMNALKAFEVVSRHGSVSKAAAELCVSQGAVSQQLRNLEDSLGHELFVRTPNSFELSADGEAFAAVVQKALMDIANAAGEITGTNSQRKITISMSKGFAVKWVMPNLGRFYDSFPDVTVAIDESIELVTFKNDGIDAAIRYCDGKFEGLDSVLLFRPHLYAVASPEYIAQHGKLESLAEPGNKSLIDHHYNAKGISAQHIHWTDLVSSSQIDLGIPHIVLPDEHQTFNAALQGRGIALVSNYLMEEELATGKIEYAHPEPIPGRFSYYFVSPVDTRPSNALLDFRDWLVASLIIYRFEEDKPPPRTAR
jgi:LysR family glycine cleavage system transcriptional activator